MNNRQRTKLLAAWASGKGSAKECRLRAWNRLAILRKNKGKIPDHVYLEKWSIDVARIRLANAELYGDQPRHMECGKFRKRQA